MGRIGRVVLAAWLLVLPAAPAAATVVVIPTTTVITVEPAETGNYDALHRIGLITYVGGKLELYKDKGFLSSAEGARDISDWAMDDVVRATLHKYLSPRFEVVDIPVDAAVADKIDTGVFRNNTSALGNYLKSLNRSDLDGFIVVRRVHNAAFTGDPKGLAFIVLPAGAAVWANYSIGIFDGRSFAQLGNAFARLQPRPGTPYFPSMKAPPGVTLSDKAELNEADVPALKTRITLLLRLSLLETLRSLNTGIVLPAPGARELVPIPADKIPLKSWKTIALVSALGQNVQFNHVGTLFRHSEAAVPFPGLDEKIEAMLAAKLDKRFTVSPAEVDRAKLAALESVISKAALENPIDALPTDAKVDGYVVLLRRSDIVGYYGPRAGVGVLNVTPMGDEFTKLFANYTLAIVDAKTRQPELLLSGRASPDSATPTPIETIDNADWPADAKQPTPEQAAAVADAVLKLMSESLDETLLRTGFTGMMVAPLPELETPPAASAAPGGAPPASPPATQ